jgi:hypothetical protein
MTEVALRSRQVAAASGSDLCSQVAALDWRRPTQCLWTLCIKRRATRPPLQPKRAVCAPTFNRPDRVAGGSRRTMAVEYLEITQVLYFILEVLRGASILRVFLRNTRRLVIFFYQLLQELFL